MLAMDWEVMMGWAVEDGDGEGGCARLNNMGGGKLGLLVVLF
jgi:hypothetical protein